MKATGIVRRIDELGRVVIPKEIRRTLRTVSYTHLDVYKRQDLWSFASLIDTFKRLQSSLSGSLLIISHQERILNIADEIVVSADGRVRSHGPREQVLPALMADESMTRCPLGKEEQPHE